MEKSLQAVYKTLPGKTVEEASKALGIEGAFIPKSSQQRFVEAFLENQVGDSRSHEGLLDKLRLQAVLLDPAHKHRKPSRSNKSQRLSTREKRKLKLHEIPPDKQHYQDFLPLHQLWLGYMEEVLQLKAGEGSKKEVNQLQLSQKVAKADYHGSILKVWRSKCPTYVGVEGILLQETQNTLRIIGKDDKIRTIPKCHSVFTFEFHGYRFYLYGNHMKFKASERSVKKFKMKPTIDL